MNHQAPMLTGENVIVISEAGRTEHMGENITACIFKHLHMLNVTSAQEVKAYRKSDQQARLLENVEVLKSPPYPQGRMQWEHIHDLDYNTLQ